MGAMGKRGDAVVVVERAMARLRRSQARRAISVLARSEGSTDHGAGARPSDAVVEALMVVEAADGAATVSSVADVMQVDRPRASRAVGAAVEAGYLRRLLADDDARVAWLELTTRGRALCEDVHAFRA